MGRLLLHAAERPEAIVLCSDDSSRSPLSYIHVRPRQMGDGLQAELLALPANISGMQIDLQTRRSALDDSARAAWLCFLEFIPFAQDPWALERALSYGTAALAEKSRLETTAGFDALSVLRGTSRTSLGLI